MSGSTGGAVFVIQSYFIASSYIFTLFVRGSAVQHLQNRDTYHFYRIELVHCWHVKYLISIRYTQFMCFLTGKMETGAKVFAITFT